jgi:hypothetical protein
VRHLCAYRVCNEEYQSESSSPRTLKWTPFIVFTFTSYSLAPPIVKRCRVKSKIKAVPVLHFTEWRYSSMHYLTSALDGGECSASRPGRFTPRDEPLLPIGQEADWAPSDVPNNLMLFLLSSKVCTDLMTVAVNSSFSVVYVRCLAHKSPFFLSALTSNPFHIFTT